MLQSLSSFTYNHAVQLSKNMHNSSEKKAFGSRLKQQLSLRHLPDSPTWLAKEFNLRYNGNPISVQAANNWLTGAAIPTQDKLQILATWLNISISWLRFGEPTNELEQEQHLPLSSKVLSDKFEKLQPKQQQLIHELIDTFLINNR